MAAQAGNLLVVRQHLTLAAGVTAVDSNIECWTNKFGPDPQMPERLMVIVMPPTAGWAAIDAMTEPYILNGRLLVDFHCSTDTVINVLFWLPHSIVGPVSVDPYGFACVGITILGEACTVSNQGA